jgi:hypothetical protein
MLEKNTHSFLEGKSEERDFFEDHGIDGRVKLNES